MLTALRLSLTLSDGIGMLTGRILSRDRLSRLRDRLSRSSDRLKRAFAGLGGVGCENRDGRKNMVGDFLDWRGLVSSGGCGSRLGFVGCGLIHPMNQRGQPMGDLLEWMRGPGGRYEARASGTGLRYLIILDPMLDRYTLRYSDAGLCVRGTLKTFKHLSEAKDVCERAERARLAAIPTEGFESVEEEDYDLAILHIVDAPERRVVRLTQRAEAGEIGSEVVFEFCDAGDLDDFISQLRAVRAEAWPSNLNL